MNAWKAKNGKSRDKLALIRKLCNEKFSLKFTGYRHSLVREFSECLAVLCLPVTHLDLSGGCLNACTSDDEILRSFCEMDNLRFLNISHNQLSDREFRSILSHYRVFRTGFRVLESLDVSGNEVSLKTLKCVLRFPQLRTIRVSIASSLVQRDSEFVNHWRECVSACGFLEDKNACTHQCSHIQTEGFGAVIVHEWEKKVIEFEMERKNKFERRRNINSSGSFYCSQPAAWTTGSSGLNISLQSEKRNKITNMKPVEIINDLKNYDTHTYKKTDRVNCVKQEENMNKKEDNFEQENRTRQRSKIEYKVNEHRLSERQQGDLDNMNWKTKEALSMNKEQQGERENFNEHRTNKTQEQKNVNKRRNTEQNTMNNKRPKIVCSMNRSKPKNIEEHRLKEQEEMKLDEELALFKKFYLKKN